MSEPWQGAPGPGGTSRRDLRTHQKRPARTRNVFAAILGVIGELLITAGVFLGLFVVWQLWWTDVAAHSAMDSVLAQFDEQSAHSADSLNAISDDERVVDDPPTVDPFSDAEVFAVLRVPRWGSDYRTPIAEGVGLENVLDKGYAGHYPETAMVGEVGNFSLAGHRMTYGAPFRNVDKLQVGDAIVVETREDWYVYEVTSWDIVDPSAVEVIAPVPGDTSAEATERMLTLTSCHPLFSTKERYIVHAKFTYSAPKSAGTPSELEG